MKAIKQIIDYLRLRGDLNLEQLKTLAVQGFLPWHEVYPEEPEEEEEPSGPEETAPEEEPEFWERTTKKGRKVQRRGATLTEEELCRHLNEAFPHWEPRLRGLLRLAQQLQPCDRWPQAAVVIRNSRPDLLTQTIEASLVRHELTLTEFWEALAEERFRTLLPEERLHGPVGAAYRAVLAAPEVSQLGRSVSLLKQEEVQHVFNLRLAQRRLVRAWADLYERRPDLIGLALHREEHWLGYWSMVLLYTARRGTPNHRPQPTVREHWPQRELPDEARMLRAWAHALVMDPQAVPPFLVEYEERWEQRPNAVHLALTIGWALLSWAARELLFKAGTRGQEQGPLAELARRDNLSPAEIEQRIQAAKALLRSSVCCGSVLLIPSDWEGETAWSALVEDWSALAGEPRIEGEQLDALVRNRFGPPGRFAVPAELGLEKLGVVPSHVLGGSDRLILVFRSARSCFSVSRLSPSRLRTANRETLKQESRNNPRANKLDGDPNRL